MKLSFMFPCRLVSQDDRGGVAPRPNLPGQLPVGGALSSQYRTVLTIDCYLTLKYVNIHSKCQQLVFNCALIDTFKALCWHLLHQIIILNKLCNIIKHCYHVCLADSVQT